MLYYIILYYTILHYNVTTILFYTMLYYTILYYITLHYTVLHYTSLYFIALRASAAVPPLICALGAGLGATGAGGRAVVYGATGYAAGARPR